MRIGFVYFKDPLKGLDGMDTIRWLELSRALTEKGYEVDMITEEGKNTDLSGCLRVRHISCVQWQVYDAIKTTHHTDAFSVPDHPFLVCRIGRIVDETHPLRVHSHRQDLLDAQDLIASRARRVVLMCEENLKRWRAAYPKGPKGIVVPNGCPMETPKISSSPYRGNRKRALYLGSLTSSRFVRMLNALGKALRKCGIELHHLGRNQLDLYGETGERLDPAYVMSHHPVLEPQSWSYLFHADVGLMFARGRHIFDNEISKVYYYLRAGVPTVSEELISTNSLIYETGWGEVVEYGDISAMAEAVKAWVEAPRSKRSEVGEMVAKRHSWENRAEILNQVFQIGLQDGLS